jgi:hypothetical protein
VTLRREAESDDSTSVQGSITDLPRFSALLSQAFGPPDVGSEYRRSLIEAVTRHEEIVDAVLKSRGPIRPTSVATPAALASMTC